MSEQKSEAKVKPMKTKATVITDPELIKKLDQIDLYIPPHETIKTYDQNALKNDQYNKSAKAMGELAPIQVAVFEDDPEKNSNNSHFRIHMRIMNGRHRYAQNKNWRRQYFDFKPVAKSGEDPFLTYMQMRQHYDLQKRQTPEEKTVLIEETAERILKTRPDIGIENVCNELAKLFVPQGLMSDVTLRNLCPTKYKNKQMSEIKQGKTFENKGRDTKKVQEAKKLVGDRFTKLEAEKNRIQTELTKIESENIGLKKDIGERDKVVDELQSKIRILRETNGEVACKSCGAKVPVKVDATNNTIIAN